MHRLVAALDLERWMHEVLVEAEAAGDAGEYPIGAVVVLDGDVLSRGRSASWNGVRNFRMRSSMRC
jgi:tRNA(Arg) A34 adenosine deaminase TadA